jgi:CHAD domain-containing protein
MADISCWQMQKDSIEMLTSLLGPEFRLRENDQSQQQFTLLDDYDWSIWQKQLLLLRDEANVMRLLQADGSCEAECSVQADNRFWWQLPAGDLSTRLKTIISVRALTGKCELVLIRKSLAILNEDDKTVVKGEFYEIKVKEREAHRFLKLRKLRGYGQEYRRIAAALSELKLTPLADVNFSEMLQQGGLEVNIPANKPDFQLQAHEAAESAVLRMADKMLQLACQQEQGIIADIDTEFVHQYRVNIRKTRSLISLFKKTLSPQRYQLLKTGLKTIGSQTNELRDLDVFLLDHDYYRSLLPETLWPGLEQLFRRIKRRRAATLKKVVEQLAGDTYMDLVSHLLQVLQQAPDLQTKQAQAEIKLLVSKKILAQYRTIQTDGEPIGEDTPDAAVHELRIECKKLRYLLELFSDLYPKHEIRRLIKFLKQLQDNLGRFNDYSVQQEFLLHFGQGTRISAEQLASINGLAAVLYNKQRYEREFVVKNIAGFLDPAIKMLVQQLFYDNPPGENIS